MHLLHISGRRLLQSGVKSTVKPTVTSSDLLSVLSGTGVPTLITEGSTLRNTNNTSSNTTGGFFTDGDDDDAGYSDMQTVALACVATLIPLFFILVAAFIVRVFWRKYQQGREGSPGSTRAVLRRDESSEPTAAKSVAASTGHLLPEELKTSESAFTVTPVEDPARLEASQSPLLGATPGHPTSGPPSSVTTVLSGNHASSKSANGSIITLTMQNNHLIVETEALCDPDLDIPLADAISADSLDLESGLSSQQAQIHDPPAEVPRSPSPPCLTGLSQSLSSITSPSYCYGTQTGYPAGGFGYTQDLGYSYHSEKASILRCPKGEVQRRRLPMQLSVQEENFAPSHHRSSSLPMRLARTQTLTETPTALQEVEEPNEVAPRGGGKYKARASLPCINPVRSAVISKLSAEAPPASIAE